jgi:predicted dehydrogenase
VPAYGTVRWGILGCGTIAGKFAEGLRAVDDAELVACGSRTQAKADRWGEAHDAPHRHGSYEDLAADEAVDVVYVATPHVFHKDHALLCLRGGKAVLCEKPFTINADEARQVADAARAAGVFCMEAMFTRFLPVMVRLRELLADGAIGEVRMVLADFSFRAGWNPDGRLLNPALGGGGLLDVGCYPVSLASLVLGRPEAVTGAAHLGDTGVDEQAGMVLRCADGRIAVLACGVRTASPRNAWILGTTGRMHLPDFPAGRQLILTAGGRDPQTIQPDLRGNGYNYQAEEVHRCLRAGRIESDVMGLDETVSIMETLDALRAQWSLRYPTE